MQLPPKEKKKKNKRKEKSYLNREKEEIQSLKFTFLYWIFKSLIYTSSNYYLKNIIMFLLSFPIFFWSDTRSVTGKTNFTLCQHEACLDEVVISDERKFSMWGNIRKMKGENIFPQTSGKCYSLPILFL